MQFRSWARVGRGALELQNDEGGAMPDRAG